jgi:8-amino-3,8-dideoxy-alpha-D-manno-octulosonate transaminase
MAGTEIFGKEELAAVQDVIERKVIHRYGSHGVRNGIYRVEEFENRAVEITGARHALAVANGTAALIVALKGIGIRPGDEVITSPFAFIATVEAIVACNAVPVLGDIDETLSLDPASAERLITEKTRAIMPVHMFGAAADMERFTELGKKYGIPIIEDACEVVGGTYKGRMLGSLGTCGTWSFDPNKTLTVGEGGIVFTDSEEIHSRMDCYHDHGHIHSKEHDRGAEGKSGLGVNYRLSELQGALGLVALQKMDYALGLLRSTKKRILQAVSDTGIVPRPTHNGCSIIADNTWHFAKHWKALEVMGEKDWFGTRTPSYAPETMAGSDRLLARAVMFGLNIIMDDSSVEKMIRAIRAGAGAAL